MDHSIGECDRLRYCTGRLGLLPGQRGSGRGLRMMGGGPRTFPGGVSKWQWKRMQEKKQQQIEKARLLRDRQLYEARRRAELMSACPEKEKPWETTSSPVGPPPKPGDPHIKALASRFNMGGAKDLWTEFDGPLYSDDDGGTSSLRSARILPGNEASPSKLRCVKTFTQSSNKRIGRSLDEPIALAPGAVEVDGTFPQQSKLQCPANACSLSHLSQTRFDSLHISPLSIQALQHVFKFETMTIVQERTCPLALEGVDVLAKARTGTGKTIAFLLPCIEAILKTRRLQHLSLEDWPVYALVVCPTRELASQAAAEATLLIKFHAGITCQVVIGGTNMSSEVARLKKFPCHLLVGTPGRLVDHIQSSRSFAERLRGLKVLVLDEADQLLEMGFRKSLDAILEALPKDRQTLLFSATIPKEVHSMGHVALKTNHVFIDTVGEEEEETHRQVDQSLVIAPLEKQLVVTSAILSEHIAEKPDFKVLVFCTTARCTQLLAEVFRELGLNVREIHSRKSQGFRTRTSDEFRRSSGGIIMFTSDVSARGVDYPDVSLVLQVGLPAGRQQYIHRLGRTGRAGKGGRGILLLSPWEQPFVKELEGLPLRITAVPVLNGVSDERLRHAIAAVNKDTKDKAYVAWLGYYNSVGGRLWDKETLVQRANLFSRTIGLPSPPILERKVVHMMGLKGVKGINIA